jgi:hypothetical protein
MNTDCWAEWILTVVGDKVAKPHPSATRSPKYLSGKESRKNIEIEVKQVVHQVNEFCKRLRRSDRYVKHCQSR